MGPFAVPARGVGRNRSLLQRHMVDEQHTADLRRFGRSVEMLGGVSVAFRLVGRFAVWVSPGRSKRFFFATRRSICWKFAEASNLLEICWATRCVGTSIRHSVQHFLKNLGCACACLRPEVEPATSKIAGNLLEICWTAKRLAKLIRAGNLLGSDLPSTQQIRCW